MVSFVAEMITAIVDLDPTRPVSTGFATPRPSAWHQAHCPLSGDCGAIDPGSSYWSPDTVDQWSQQFAAQSVGPSVWSIHLYDSSTCYFSPDGGDCANLTDIIEIAASTASDNNAVLFLGEYGGPQ